MFEFFQETAVAKDDVKHASHDGANAEKDVKKDKKKGGSREKYQSRCDKKAIGKVLTGRHLHTNDRPHSQSHLNAR